MAWRVFGQELQRRAPEGVRPRAAGSDQCAAQTVMKSLWAKAYCQQQSEKGHRNQSILRGLASKWQSILFRCWKNHERYEEKRYLEVLDKKSSPLLPVIAEIRKTHPKLCEQFA